MYIYLAIYSALALKALDGSPKRNATYFLIVAIFLVWFMGFRYETGCDYYGYLNRWLYFETPASLMELLQGQEPGFALLTTFVKMLGLDYTWLNVFVSAILVACYIRFASVHAFAPLVLALLFPIIIVQLGMSGIRQALAGGFLMLAFNAFVEKDKLWTAIFIIVGMQFHASVIIFLPIALIAGRKVDSKRIAMALLALAPFSVLLLGDRLYVYQDRYAAGEVTSSGAIIRYALVLLPVPFFFLTRDRVQALYPEVYPLLKLGVLMIMSLAPLVIFSSIALHRLNYYVLPLSILLFVYVGAVISKKVSDGHWLAILAFGGYSFFWFLNSRHAQSCYVPYENIWFM
jgi:hypothetical protein